MKITHAIWMSFFFALLPWVAPMVCAEDTDSSPSDVYAMSLEELMDIPVVVSSSRQEQKLNEASTSMIVITAQDIHYSGLTSIGEVLQFACGIDMLKFNRYWDVVGIRGMHDQFSDRMQVLINGRLADNALFGGPLFFTFPVMLEDIDRIEIVRGPASAAWGANALNGVINIITKKPADVTGVFASTTVTQFGDTYTHLRYAEQKGDWQWRISTGYESMEDSDDALEGGSVHFTSFMPSLNGLIGYNSYEARDFMRSFRMDTEAIYSQPDVTTSFGLGYAEGVMGDFESEGLYLRENSRFQRIRPFVRVDRQFSNDDSLSLEWSGNIETINLKNLSILDSVENALMGQYNFSPVGRHNISVGTNLRWHHLRFKKDIDQGVYAQDNPYNEYSAGIFVIDRWALTDRCTLEAQLRGDYYSEVSNDWAGRLGATYSLDAQKAHMLRFGIAKAYRTPSLQPREVLLQYIPTGPGTYLYNASKPDDLDNEQIVSFEAGYTGKLADGLTFNADMYYQDYSDLLGYRLSSANVFTADNIDGATAWGGEAELVIQNKRGKLSTWYAYQDFQENRLHQSLRALLPAKHKVGLRGTLFLWDGWVLNTNYRIADTTANASFDDSYLYAIKNFSRLDLTLSRKFVSDRVELMFGVRDLLNKTTDYYYSGVVNLTSHKMPGRTFFARVQIEF